MRTRALLLLLLMALGLSGIPASQAAPELAVAPYNIPWWTVDGGGGSSTGGGYALSGTAGQPDSGPTMTGGPYALTGGFWNDPFKGVSGYRPIDLLLPIIRR